MVLTEIFQKAIIISNYNKLCHKMFDRTGEKWWIVWNKNNATAQIFGKKFNSGETKQTGGKNEMHNKKIYIIPETCLCHILESVHPTHKENIILDKAVFWSLLER